MPWPKGQKRSPETRAKISAGLTGRPMSDRTREALYTSRKGTTHTPEARAKISAALMGRVISPEHRVKLSNANKGRPLTVEHRAKISAANSIAQMGNRHVLDAPVKGFCVYCFSPAAAHDHVIPRGRPGWDDPDNVVLCCISCNSSKSNRTPAEWFAEAIPAH